MSAAAGRALLLDRQALLMTFALDLTPADASEEERRDLALLALIDAAGAVADEGGHFQVRRALLLIRGVALAAAALGDREASPVERRGALHRVSEALLELVGYAQRERNGIVALLECAATVRPAPPAAGEESRP